MDEDPVTGRRILTQSAYADGRHLRARVAIFAYAEQPADPRWRTSAIPWDGTQIVADIGCGAGFDLRQLIPDGRCRHAFGIDLSAGMLRTLAGLRSSGRLTLIQADAQQLPLRQSGVDVGLAMHMLYHVPDVHSAIRELRRIVKPEGTVLASTNSAETMREVHDLLDAAISQLLGHPVHALPDLSFTTQIGATLLEHEFSDVILNEQKVTLAFPTARPVIDYLNSIREPIERHIGERFSFDTALNDVATRVERVIHAHGSFRATSISGVFVCR